MCVTHVGGVRPPETGKGGRSGPLPRTGARPSTREQRHRTTPALSCCTAMHRSSPSVATRRSARHMTSCSCSSAPVPQRATQSRGVLATSRGPRPVIRKSGVRRTPFDLDFRGGDDGNRTHDPLLAKQPRQSTSVQIRPQTRRSRCTSGVSPCRSVPPRHGAPAEISRSAASLRDWPRGRDGFVRLGGESWSNGRDLAHPRPPERFKLLM